MNDHSSNAPPTGDRQGLRFGPVGRDAVHLCVDMQRLFAEQTPWRTPWMERVAPQTVKLTAHRPERTIFTRFVPARRPGEGGGTWRRYWERWSSMTIEAIGEPMIELIPALARFVPPAQIVDKTVYSPWLDTDLETRLKALGTDTLVVSGGETDVCVLATVLGGVDRGYRIVLATDALCSSADETHDALLRVYHDRYGQQVETVETAPLLANWR